MPKYTRHIFICGNQRPGDHPRGSCDPAGAGALQRAFKASLAQTSARASVRANKAGCLDQCEHGPTVVVYPEAVWYGNISPADVDLIVQEHIVGGRPVERLQIADACLNNASCPHRKPQNG
jgi:(2Fe-2S) ferredoxin